MSTVAAVKEAPKPEKKVDADWCSIHKAIPQITGAIEPIEKTHNNKQGYTFRGIDDVYSVLNLLLEKFGISIMPEVLEAQRESHQTKNGTTMFKTVLRVCYHLYASDGSTLECVVEGEAMDSGDKSTQKALSMAYKYMAFQVFCIPTGEKIDTENESPEVVGPAQKKPAQPSMWQRIKTLADGYDFPTGENDADLKGAVKAATGKSKPAELTEEDFVKIEAALAKAVTPPAPINANAKDEEIPF